MAESRCSCNSGSSSISPCGRENVCIDTFRVLDSCRDRDCFENARVYLTPFGQEIVERTQTVRAICAEILGTYVGVDPIPFNRGFYQVTIRFYIKVRFEACIGIGRAQEFEGLAVLDKKVVLYGGEGNVSIFKSVGCTGFCDFPAEGNMSTNMPIGVVETVEPVVLGVRVFERSCECSCLCDLSQDVPERINGCFNGGLCGGGNNAFLAVSLGIFSVVRIERPAQFMIQATDYTVPDKECVATEEGDPCSLFRSMAFPANEFSPTQCHSSKRDG